MTYTLASERDQALVEEATRNPEGTARLTLRIGDEDYSAKLDEGEWGQTEIPYSLDATLSSVLPRRLDNEEVFLSVEIAGVTVPAMVGYLSMSEVNADLISTDLLSASAGALFGGDNAIRVGEELTFEGNSPEYIVRDAALRMPYGRGGIRIDPLGSPTLAYDGDEGFRPEEEVGAILSRIGELSVYLMRDTQDGGFAATLTVPLSRRIPARTYQAKDMPNWRPPPRAELYYSDVVVFSPAGRFEPARKAVEYRHLTRRDFVFANQTKYIPLGDPTESGSESASRRAYDETERLRDLTHRSELMLPAFDPLVERGDPFRVEEVFRDDDGTWDRAWLCEVETLKHPFSVSLDTVVGYAGTIVEEEIVRVPALIVPALSPGVLTTPPPPYGYTAANQPYINDEVAPWATYDSQTNEVIIDSQLALEYGIRVFYEVTESGDYQLVLREEG